ncbi:MAG: adenylate/guanylate cyclase domain-containing protein [Thiotrichaceae bacterium]|nr:adenylate/guanylate cyclase domain-containing protein [Thiotrichaceae bacterium]
MYGTPAKTHLPELDKVKILLVDENASHLNFLVGCLRNNDRVLLAAASGEQALQLLRENPDIALVLLAAQMQGMDGYTTASKMRDMVTGTELPIIFMASGEDTDDQHIFKGYDSGAVDYLIQPININILMNKVAVFIRLYYQSYLLRETNQCLEQKISEHQQTAEELHGYREHLEAEVERRTLALQHANQNLQDEIEEHLETERALMEAEKRYRSIFENTLEGIFQTTPDGHYLNANPSLVNIYGYSCTLELMQSLNDIGLQLYIQEGRREEFLKIMDRQGYVADFESQVKRKDGKIIWISENARAVKGEDGNVLYFEGTVEDISERKKAEVELQQINEAYRRFVPHDFLRLLNKKSIVEVNLNDYVQREMSILFCDIRSFTMMSERMTPQQTFEFINSYLSVMGPVVRDHHGFIDKYIGDSIMALFDKTPDDAVQAAIVMVQALAPYNAYRGALAERHEPIKIGIGINTGLMMLGTIGEYHRMEGTVISDAVNVASRIEALTKTYGVPLLISETTFQKMHNPSQYAIRFIDRVKVKGKSTEVVIHEVFQADEPEVREGKLATRDEFEQACLLYHQGLFIEADEIFNACLAVNPQDSVAQVYKKRCMAMRGTVDHFL